MSMRQFCAAVLLVVSLSSVSTAQEEQIAPFKMIELDTLGGRFSAAVDVNSRGVVLGRSETSDFKRRAFLWDGGRNLLELETLGGAHSEPKAMNDLTQVVGSSDTVTGEQHAFLWDPDLGIIDLGTLGGSFSEALDVNAAGEVVGVSTTVEGARRGFLWTAEEGMIDLGTLAGLFSAARFINDRGEIGGWSHDSIGFRHAVLWTVDGEMIDLGFAHTSVVGLNERGQVAGNDDPFFRGSRPFVASATQRYDLQTSGSSAFAWAINDLAQVGGYVIVPGGASAALWEADGTLRSLGTLGGFVAEALDVNNAGHAAGTSYLATDVFPHAFFWSPELGMTDLGRPGSRSSVVRMNDDDVIVGDATSSDGFARAVVWVPVPLNDLAILIELVESLPLENQLGNSLLAKLDQAWDALTDSNDHNDHVAANKLWDFSDQVAAQAGNAIAEEDAIILILLAEEIARLVELGT